jgi:hypothetical protein
MEYDMTQNDTSTSTSTDHLLAKLLEMMASESSAARMAMAVNAMIKVNKECTAKMVECTTKVGELFAVNDELANENKALREAPGSQTELSGGSEVLKLLTIALVTALLYLLWRAHAMLREKDDKISVLEEAVKVQRAREGADGEE